MLTRKEKQIYDLLIATYKNAKVKDELYIPTYAKQFMSHMIDRPKDFIHLNLLSVEDYESQNYIATYPIFQLHYSSTQVTISLEENHLKRMLNTTLLNNKLVKPYYLVITGEVFQTNQEIIDYLTPDYTCDETQSYTAGFINFLELENEHNVIEKEIDNLLSKPLTAAVKAQLNLYHMRLLEIEELNRVNKKTYVIETKGV